MDWRTRRHSFTVADEYMWVTIIHIIRLASYFTTFARIDKLNFGV